MEEKNNNVNEESLKEKEISNKEEIKTEKSVLEEKTLYERNDVNNFDALYETSVNNQTNFSTSYKKIRRISNIVMFSIMAIILVLLFVFGNNPAFIGVAIALVVVYLVGLFVSQKKIKEKLNVESTKVVSDYFTNLDSYVTRDEHFKDVKFNYEIKLPEDTFKNLRLFKDIYYVGGRDYIEGKFNDVSFVAGDNIIKTHGTKEDGTKQDYIVFLGKLFSFDKSLTNEGRAIIYLKGKSLNLPTDIDNLNVVDGILDEKFVVYSNFDVSNILNEIKEDLEKYSIDNQLLDMFISITEEKIGFAFSYADSVMSVPLLDPVNKDDLTRYTQDVDIMIDIMKKLVK